MDHSQTSSAFSSNTQEAPTINNIHFENASKCVASLKQNHTKEAFTETKKALQTCSDTYPTDHKGKTILKRCIEGVEVIESNNQKIFGILLYLN